MGKEMVMVNKSGLMVHVMKDNGIGEESKETAHTTMQMETSTPVIG